MMEQLIQDGELYFKWLGAGGNGLFALDITNPNSPTHLFAINNDELIKQFSIGDLIDFKNEFGYAGGSY